MPPLQPYVPNVPLVVAKNLRFDGDNGIPVTEMLPIGMSGNVPADNPKTGYISRIGAILSDQIDLYNNVVVTLTAYGDDISNLQSAVAAIETSGKTMPFVDGACYNGSQQILVQDALQLVIDSSCTYNTVLGTASALTEAILAESPTVLNARPAYSQSSDMAGLSGWNSDPGTIADTVNNLWLSYLDSRSGLDKMLSLLRPVCSEAIIDFLGTYTTSGAAAGFSVYFSGYSFIPSGYTNNGSTITITDGVGGIFTTAVDIVARSQPGADPLFVGISGTPLSANSSLYTFTLNSAIVNSTYSCTKTVIHTTSNGSNTETNPFFDLGTYTATISGSTSVLSNFISGLSYVPRIVLITSLNTYSGALIRDHGYFISKTIGGATLNFSSVTGQDVGVFSVDWIAYR